MWLVGSVQSSDSSPPPNGACDRDRISPGVGRTRARRSWCGSLNSTIFSDIVPVELRSSVFALNTALTGLFSAGTPLAVGLLTEAFGCEKKKRATRAVGAARRCRRRGEVE